MALTREALWTQLKLGEIAPVYLLFGPETRLRDTAAATIADHAFSAGDLRDFNESSFSLNNDGNLKSALAAAWQLPMMAARRVIRITDVRVSATGHRDTLTEDDLDVLNAYFAEPSPTSVVVFIADELNGVRKMGKLLREKTACVEFVSPSEDQLEAIAKRRINELGLAIDNAGLGQLLSLVGPDVRRLSNELDKLATAALPGKMITGEMIDSLVAHSRTLSNFDLTDHLVGGRRKQALRALRQMLEDGAEPVALLGLIGASYRQLLSAKYLMDRGAPRQEVVRSLKVPFHKQEPILAAARRTELKKLEQAIKNVARTDLAIKTSLGGSGPKGARAQVEMLVCGLALL
jgi:DNA polymerase-3 subunit delta